MLRLAFAVALCGLALGASACGGDDEDPAQAWVNGVCSALTTWSDSTTASLDSVKNGNLSQDSLNAAVDDVKGATNKLKTDLTDLGAPDTEGGDEAQEKVTTFVDDIAAGQQKVEDAFSSANGVSETLAAAAVATSTLATLAEQGKTTFNDLESLSADTSNDLKNAFESSDECKSVREQLDRLGGS